VLYVAQAVQANGPSALYHKTLHAVLDDVKALQPPTLVAESVVASYFRDLYLDPDETQTHVIILHTEHQAADYEKWLRSHDMQLENGTFLITGFASFIHYGAHIDGPRLRWFNEPLSPDWKLVREYDVLTYLPRPEPARIWRLERAEAPRVVQHDEREDLSPSEGHRRSGCTAPRRHGALRQERQRRRAHLVQEADGENDPEAENGAFFYAASFFRGGDFMRARHEFKRLIRRFPTGRWVPSAYWHLGCVREGARPHGPLTPALREHRPPLPERPRHGRDGEARAHDVRAPPRRRPREVVARRLNQRGDSVPSPRRGQAAPGTHSRLARARPRATRADSRVANHLLGQRVSRGSSTKGVGSPIVDLRECRVHGIEQVVLLFRHDRRSGRRAPASVPQRATRRRAAASAASPALVRHDARQLGQARASRPASDRS
jgi:hypothetical protein